MERATPEVLEAIGRGLHEGARQAGISIVGGETAQLAEMIRGAREGSGLDLVGMCVGTVPLERVNTGQSVRPGDAILGFASSVSDAEMYRVFNMGVGFCAIAPKDPDVVRSVRETAEKYGCEAFVVGETVEDPERRVVIPQKKLIGKEDRFFAG